MNVLLEFTVGAEQFKLGHVLSAGGKLHFELERIVPTGGHVMPFVWVATEGDPNEALPRFEAHVRDSEHVVELLALDRVADGALYRIEWGEQTEGLFQALAETEATVLEAYGNETWTFRIRFTDHDRLSDFHNYLTDNDVSVHIVRTCTFTEESARRRDFGFSNEQRESLVLALQRGYFFDPERGEPRGSGGRTRHHEAGGVEPDPARKRKDAGPALALLGGGVTRPARRRPPVKSG